MGEGSARVTGSGHSLHLLSDHPPRKEPIINFSPTDLRLAVAAGLARNNLRALAVALSLTLCGFCGKAPRPTGDEPCDHCGL